MNYFGQNAHILNFFLQFKEIVRETTDFKVLENHNFIKMNYLNFSID